MDKISREELRRMNVPVRYWGARRDTLHIDILKVVENIYDKVFPSGGSIILYGNAGVGKTYIASLLCKMHRAAEYSVLFLLGIFTDYKSMDELWEDSVKTIDRAKKVDLLVIDGIGEEDFSDTWEKVFLYRIENKKPTILTTRLSPEQFKDVYGGGFTNSIRGAVVPINIIGKDMRDSESEQLKNLIAGDDDE